uniref:flagellum-associated coiled-coil domain-containing protein 1 isoform X2 n=1 Tax=Ictidomys tridecemlineatus TaxID=43179 RepID=UPI001A9EDB22|nr:flagellum-associated coiled-coil domain-containing protein 1 isoform X2 [Ictidomys tridecemlineatus]
MYHNPLIYCTCWDPWNLGPRKLIKTLQPPNKAPTRKSKSTPLLPATKEQNYLQSPPSTKPVDVPKVKTNVGRQEEGCKSPYEVINVSPGYQLARHREQISVTLGDEMFGRKKRLESEMMDKFSMSRTNIISDLEEQISELTALIEQMNRDHQADQKLDSIYDEIEEKWSKRKAEWEKDEKLEREKILLQQKHKMTKKFELESEEEKKKITESYSASIENLISEKEELLKQHESDTLQLEELRKTKAIMEEELHAQAIILESLNAHLYQTQMELQKEKATVGNLEKMFQIKLAEANEKHKHTIDSLTEENLLLRQKIAKNEEEVYERQSGTLPSLASYEYNYDYDIEYDNKKQES